MWFKVDDSLCLHPKATAAGSPALGLWVVAGAWSSRNLTDGFVPDHVIPRLDADGVQLAEKLVAVGLWRRARGGYLFHDWDAYQPDSASVRRERDRISELRREAGRKGGLTSGKSRQRSKIEANHEAKSKQTTKQSSKPNEAPFPYPYQGASTKHQNPPSGSPPADDEANADQHERSRCDAQRPPRGRRIPDDFAATDAMIAWAREHTPLVGRDETAAFVDYWQAETGQRATKRDWIAAWRTWMRRAQKDAQRRCPPPQRAAANGYRSRTDDNIIAFANRDFSSAATELYALPGGDHAG